jgi:hypothetical protein
MDEVQKSCNIERSLEPFIVMILSQDRGEHGLGSNPVLLQHKSGTLPLRHVCVLRYHNIFLNTDVFCSFSYFCINP